MHGTYDKITRVRKVHGKERATYQADPPAAISGTHSPGCPCTQPKSQLGKIKHIYDRQKMSKSQFL